MKVSIMESQSLLICLCSGLELSKPTIEQCNMLFSLKRNQRQLAISVHF